MHSSGQVDRINVTLSLNFAVIGNHEVEHIATEFSGGEGNEGEEVVILDPSHVSIPPYHTALSVFMYFLAFDAKSPRCSQRPAHTAE